MTPDERLEALLNRAGQTITDLPKPSVVVYAYPKDMRRYIPDVAARWHGRLNYGSCDLEDYILHLTDVIDRMETALENVCGERDYFRQLLSREAPCMICVNGNLWHLDEPCSTCLNKNDVSFFECEGVPENWRADND